MSEERRHAWFSQYQDKHCREWRGHHTLVLARSYREESYKRLVKNGVIRLDDGTEHEFTEISFEKSDNKPEDSIYLGEGVIVTYPVWEDHPNPL